MKSYILKALLLGLALLALSYHRSELQAPAIVNKTQAVEVVSLTPSGPLGPNYQSYELVLRNVSAKNIDGYSIAFGRNASVTGDLTSASRLIAPGDQFQEVLSEANNIVIRYVIFEDGLIQGDAGAASELLDRREGMRLELERIAPLLNAAGVSTDIDQLKAQLRALPAEAAAPGRSAYVTLGMRNAREDTLLDIEKLDKSDLRAGLARLVEQHSKRLMHLTKRNNL